MCLPLSGFYTLRATLKIHLLCFVQLVKKPAIYTLQIQTFHRTQRRLYRTTNWIEWSSPSFTLIKVMTLIYRKREKYTETCCFTKVSHYVLSLTPISLDSLASRVPSTPIAKYGQQYCSSVSTLLGNFHTGANPATLTLGRQLLLFLLPLDPTNMTWRFRIHYGKIQSH